MPAVELPIGNRTYELACVAGEENHLRTLAAKIHTRVSELGRSMPGASDPLLLVMAAITLQDALDEAQSNTAHVAPTADATPTQAQRNSDDADQLASAMHAIATYVETFTARLESEMQRKPSTSQATRTDAMHEHSQSAVELEHA